MKKLSRIFLSLCILFLLQVCHEGNIYAEYLPAQTAIINGTYRHPLTNVIEDSGGEANEALGQSMISNVVDSIALFEDNLDGNYYLTLRFHMMDSITEVNLSTMTKNDESWSPVVTECTNACDDICDYRILISDKETYVRAECYVEPMGRSVIFFLSIDGFTVGNQGNFVQTDHYSVDSEKTITANSTFSEKMADTEGLVLSQSNTNNSIDKNSLSSTQSSVKNSVKPSTTPTDNSNIFPTTTVENNDLSFSTYNEVLQVQPLLIDTTVWILLFTIIFSATLTGLLSFWGIKLLFEKRIINKNTLKISEKEIQEEADASLQFWKDWEEINDEAV